MILKTPRILHHLTPLFFLLFLCGFTISAQDKKERDKNEVESILTTNTIVQDTIVKNKRDIINPLAPAKAAFFSAILPGLGQAYNKKYWKIPVIYAVIGTGVYFYVTNDNEYNRYRDAYKSRLAGLETDEFYFDSRGEKLLEPRVTTEGLERAQGIFRKQKEISLLITIGLYALNIIDANVDAHLLQYNVDENLSLAPHYKFNEVNATSNVGLTLNFKF